MQPAGMLSVQEDLCGPCLKGRREAAAQEQVRGQVGPKYARCCFENFRQAPATAMAWRVLRDYVESPSGGIFLYGPSGTGKTHLATAMMRAFIQRGQECQYLTYPEMLVRFRRSLEQAQASLEEEILAYCHAPILILDDLGVGHISEWARQMVHLLLDRRDRYLKPVVLVSNLSLEQIALLLGDPIASRIAGMCRIIKVDGEDRRLAGPLSAPPAFHDA